MPGDLEFAFWEGDHIARAKFPAAAVVALAIYGDWVIGEVDFLFSALTHDAQELQKLSGEFERFTTRWSSITRDFEKTSEDIQSIDTTAKKIVNQFRKIDNVELDGLLEVSEYEEH